MIFKRKVGSVAPDMVCRGCTKREARIRSQQDVINLLTFVTAVLLIAVAFKFCSSV